MNWRAEVQVEENMEIATIAKENTLKLKCLIVSWHTREARSMFCFVLLCFVSTICQLDNVSLHGNHARGRSMDGRRRKLLDPMHVAFLQFGDVNGTLGLHFLKAEM